jgi:hypothetical protein
MNPNINIEQKDELPENITDEMLRAAVNYYISIPEEKRLEHFMPQKYAVVVPSVAAEATVELFDENPNLPINEVVARVLLDFELHLSNEMTLKVTQTVIDTWEECKAEKWSETELAQAA